MYHPEAIYYSHILTHHVNTSLMPHQKGMAAAVIAS